MNTGELERIRAEFPALDQDVHDHPLAYLDSAATALKPRRVIDAVTAVYTRDTGNIHRGVHALAERATIAYEASREKVASFVGAQSDQIVFCRGTTEALNLVAGAWAAPRITAGDRIVVSVLEHHSNLIPWQRLASRTGAELASAPITESGELDLDATLELIDARTRVVAITHVSSVLGSVVDVSRVAARARDVGAISVIDGAQAVAHQAVDFAALGCDFYAFSGHKLYGPDGIGVLVGRSERLAETEPWQTGGGMVVHVSSDHATFAEPPRRFEAGTPPVAGAIGLAAAIEFVSGLGWGLVASHERALLEHARQVLGQLAGLTVHAAPSSRSIVSFVLDGIHPHDIATIADSDGVAIRSGHHCAQPLMSRLGLDATARVSMAIYNQPAEIDRLGRALERALAIFS